MARRFTERLDPEMTGKLIELIGAAGEVTACDAAIEQLQGLLNAQDLTREHRHVERTLDLIMDQKGAALAELADRLDDWMAARLPALLADLGVEVKG